MWLKLGVFFCPTWVPPSHRDWCWMTKWQSHCLEYNMKSVVFVDIFSRIAHRIETGRLFMNGWIDWRYQKFFSLGTGTQYHFSWAPSLYSQGIKARMWSQLAFWGLKSSVWFTKIASHCCTWVKIRTPGEKVAINREKNNKLYWLFNFQSISISDQLVRSKMKAKYVAHWHTVCPKSMVKS